MAFQMVHMEVAYRLLQRMSGIANPANYILGAVAPDSVHMSSDYEVSQKIKSHLFEECGTWGDTQDYDRWLQNIFHFWNNYGKENRNLDEKSFVFGICVHCLTDYCNDLYLWRKLQKRYLPSMTLEDFRAAYYPEAAGMDKWLYQNSPNTPEICRLLLEGQGFELNGLLKAENMDSMKQHLLYTQYAVEPVDISKYHFLSKEMTETFIQETVRELEEKLYEL